MQRITTATIAGKEYPLNFSVKAARAVEETFGGLEHIEGVFGVSENFCTNLFNIHWLLHLLMEQGSEYAKLTQGAEIQIPTQDELAVLVGVHNMLDAQGAVLQAIGFGMQTTVEVEQDPKNEQTTQSD